MKQVQTLVRLGALCSAILMVAASASAENCGYECYYEKTNCRIEAEPCGSNPDGTVMMCPVEVCDIVEVCYEKPCTTEPVPGPIQPIPVPVLPGGPGEPPLPRPVPF